MPTYERKLTVGDGHEAVGMPPLSQKTCIHACTLLITSLYREVKAQILHTYEPTRTFITRTLVKDMVSLDVIVFSNIHSLPVVVKQQQTEDGWIVAIDKFNSTRAIHEGPSYL